MQYLERAYRDPSAAMDYANILKLRGAYRVLIQPKNGTHVLMAWFRTNPH